MFLLVCRCSWRVGVLIGVLVGASLERAFRGEGLLTLEIDALFEMGLGGVLESIPSRRVESWNIWIDDEEVFVTDKMA